MMWRESSIRFLWSAVVYACSVVGVALLVLAAGYGWVLNITAIANASEDANMAMLVVRIAGVVIPPLGAVLGFI